MTATVHILGSPAGSGKTTHLLARCRAASARGAGAVLWLAPTLRRAEHVRGLLTAEADCLSPFVLTFQDFADDLVAVNDPDARPLSRVQRRLLLDEVIAELHNQGHLPYFTRVVDTRGFAEGIFALLEELQRQEITPAQFARSAGADGAAHAKERQCAHVYARYQQCLADEQLLDPEGRLWRARDLLAQGCLRPF